MQIKENKNPYELVSLTNELVGWWTTSTPILHIRTLKNSPPSTI